MPHAPFDGILHDADCKDDTPPAAPAAHHAPEDDHADIPMVHTPPQDPENAHQDQPIQPAVEAADAFLALHDMMSKIITFAPSILKQLSGTNVVITRCQLINVDDAHGPIKKCLLTITTEAPPEPVISSVMISEVLDHTASSKLSLIPSPKPVLSPAMLDFMAINPNSPTAEPLQELIEDLPIVPAIASTPAINKRKKVNAPLDVNELRRSRRLAGLSVGFKNEAAANKAKIISNCQKNLNTEFEHEVRDPTAPPPPDLPLGTIQALATKQCLIPPKEVSEEKLMAKVDHE